MRTLLKLIFLLSLLSSCQPHEEEAPTELPPVEVTTLKIKPQTIPAIFEYVGFAQSSHPVEIRARVEGYLDKIAYTEGEIVHEGDLLFQIDPRPFQASLDVAKGELARQEAILWNAKRSVDRLKPLFEQNAASRRDLDNAISQQLASEADVQSAKAKVTEAELNLNYTTINSPITGLSSRSNYREGALISPGPNGLLTTISVINPMWVDFSVSQADLLKYGDETQKGLLIQPKDQKYKVEIVLANGSVYPYKGNVNFAEPILAQSTGTMHIRAEINNPTGVLLPGQFVKVRVLGVIRPNAILVPQRAVQQGKKGMFVYVVQNGKAVTRYIEPGDWYKDQWIINSGLQKGDVVITDGVNKVQQGSTVIEKKPTESPAPKTATTPNNPTP